MIIATQVNTGSVIQGCMQTLPTELTFWSYHSDRHQWSAQSCSLDVARTYRYLQRLWDPWFSEGFM